MTAGQIEAILWASRRSVVRGEMPSITPDPDLDTTLLAQKLSMIIVAAQADARERSFVEAAGIAAEEYKPFFPDGIRNGAGEGEKVAAYIESRLLELAKAVTLSTTATAMQAHEEERKRRS